MLKRRSKALLIFGELWVEEWANGEFFLVRFFETDSFFFFSLVFFFNQFNLKSVTFTIFSRYFHNILHLLD